LAAKGPAKRSTTFNELAPQTVYGLSEACQRDGEKRQNGKHQR
jgi:hypothetical protein